MLAAGQNAISMLVFVIGGKFETAELEPILQRRGQ